MKASLKKSASKKTEREPSELAQLTLRSLNRHIADEAAEERRAGEAVEAASKAREVEAFREAVATGVVVFQAAEGEVAVEIVEGSPRRRRVLEYDVKGAVLTPASEALARRVSDDIERLQRFGEKRSSSGGRRPLTPWGQPMRGYKARDKKSAKGTARRRLKAK